MVSEETSIRVRRLVTWGGAAAAVVLMVATFLGQRVPQTTFSQVNGRYSSACCQDIVITDGVISYGGQTAKITLVTEKKFGTQGWLDRPIGPFFFVDGGQKTPPTLSFDSYDRFSISDSQGNSREFVRNKVPAIR